MKNAVRVANKQNGRASADDNAVTAATAAAAVETTQDSSSPTKPIRLVHVLNIYADPKQPLHQPYDQWVTLQSIERAKKHVPKGLEVTLVCAVLKHDTKYLKKKKLSVCDHWTILHDSTETEYVDLKDPNKFDNKTKATLRGIFQREEGEFMRLPFMQDVIDAGVDAARKDSNDDFYLMLTNADIGLSKNFYSFVLPKLQKGRKAFTINRVTMYAKTEKTNITVLEPTEDAAKIERLFEEIDVNIGFRSTRHPGTDGFFIKSSIVDQIHLGKQFPGYGHWAGVLKMILRDMLARDDFDITESSPWGSFHLGDDKTWKKKKKSPKDEERLEYVKEHFREQILLCPVQRPLHSAITAMNQVGCGLAFQEHYQEFLMETRGVCRHSFNYGWYRGESKECDEFILNGGPYPWGNHEKPDPFQPHENFNVYPDQIPEGGVLPPL